MTDRQSPHPESARDVVPSDDGRGRRMRVYAIIFAVVAGLVAGGMWLVSVGAVTGTSADGNCDSCRPAVATY